MDLIFVVLKLRGNHSTNPPLNATLIRHTNWYSCTATQLFHIKMLSHFNHEAMSDAFISNTKRIVVGGECEAINISFDHFLWRLLINYSYRQLERNNVTKSVQTLQTGMQWVYSVILLAAKRENPCLNISPTLQSRLSWVSKRGHELNISEK
jgi:hypothetical protein